MPVRVVVALFGALEAVALGVVALSGVDRRLLVLRRGEPVGREQPLVPFSHFALHPEIIRLVLAVVAPEIALFRAGRLVGVGRLALVLVGPRILVPCVLPIVVLPAADRGDPFAVPQPGHGVLAGVLDDNLAVQIGVFPATAVLRRPLEVEQRTGVVVHHALARAGKRRVVRIRRGVVVVVRVHRAGRRAVIADVVTRVGVVLRVEQAVVVAHVALHLVELVVAAADVVQVEIGARARRGQRCAEEGEREEQERRQW